MPFPPGGSSDLAAQVLSQHLQKSIKQTIAIDNRGGAGGNIGSEIVARSAPDGHNFLITAERPITISPSLYQKLGYVPSRDLVAITPVTTYSNVVVVHPSVRANTMQEFIAVAQEQPKKVTYAHPGIGTNLPEVRGRDGFFSADPLQKNRVRRDQRGCITAHFTDGGEGPAVQKE